MDNETHGTLTAHVLEVDEEYTLMFPDGCEPTWWVRVFAPGDTDTEELAFPPLPQMTAKQAQAFFLAADDALAGKGPSVVSKDDGAAHGLAELVKAAARAIRGVE